MKQEIELVWPYYSLGVGIIKSGRTAGHNNTILLMVWDGITVSGILPHALPEMWPDLPTCRLGAFYFFLAQKKNSRIYSFHSMC